MQKCHKIEPCFAKEGGYCKILTNTIFRGDCPFRKEPVCNRISIVDGKRWVYLDNDIAVSELGEVWNTHTGYIYKGTLTKKGIFVVNLRYKKKSYTIYVAKTVADAFVPGEGKIMHKNGDLTDCRAENLERK